MGVPSVKPVDSFKTTAGFSVRKVMEEGSFKGPSFCISGIMVYARESPGVDAGGSTGPLDVGVGKAKTPISADEDDEDATSFWRGVVPLAVER